MAKSDSSTGVSVQIGNLQGNPHFNHVDRAPYELGSLLKLLPANPSSFEKQTQENLLIAQAAAQHAENASSTILNGFDAIGKILYVAATNKNNDIDPSQIQDLGYLISHLAVEAQFLRDIASDMNFIVVAHNGGNHG